MEGRILCCGMPKLCCELVNGRGLQVINYSINTRNGFCRRQWKLDQYRLKCDRCTSK